MQTNDGALLFQVRADQSQIQKDVEAIKKQFEQMTNKAVEEGKKQAEVWQNLIKGATAYFTFQGASAFIKQVVAVRSQFQQLEISFSTMLKSKEKANALMAQMADLAAKTPFDLSTVSEGAKRLLAFQVPAEEVTETLRRMGDVAAGLGVPMGQLIHVYGQVKAQGKLMTNDLYQFMNAGIPIIAELSKVVGKSETEIKDMVSAGKIGFPEVQAVIKNMTNEGGLFFNLMAEQSKSLGGQISNLKDNFAQVLNEIGKATEGIASGAISSVSFLVENYQTLGKVIAGLIATYGTYRTAVLINNAIVAVNTEITKGWTIAQLAQYKGLLLLEKAQKLLNTTMLSNPYVLVATAVAGLVSAFVFLRQETDANAEATERHNQLREEQANKIDKEKNRINKLIGVIQDETKSWNERNKAFLELQNTTDGVLDKYSSLNQVLREMSQVLKDLNGRYETMNDNLSREAVTNTEKSIQAKEAEIKRLEKLQEKVDSTASVGIQQSIDRLKKQIESDKLLMSKQKKVVVKLDVNNYENALSSKNLADIQAEKKLINEAYNIKKKEREGLAKFSYNKVDSNNPYLKFSWEELGMYNQATERQIKLKQQENEKTTDTRKLYADILSLQKKISKQKNANKNSIVSETTERELSENENTLKGYIDRYKSLTGIDLTERNSSKKSTKTKTKSELPTFDYEKYARDRERLEKDRMFEEDEAKIRGMKEGAEKRNALLAFEYEKRAETIKRKGEDELQAFIEQQKAQDEAAGKWKKGEDFNTDTEAIHKEEARIAENQRVLNQDNLDEYTRQQEAMYKELLEKYQTYTDQRKAIEEKYNADIAAMQAKLGADAPQVKKAQDEKARELKKLDILYKKEGTAIAKLFENMRKKTVKEIRQTIVDAEKEIDALASTLDMSDKDNVEYIQNLRQQLEQARDTANRSDTAFGKLGTNIKKMFKSKPNTAEWQEAFNGMLSSAQAVSGAIKSFGSDFSKLGENTGNEALKKIGKTMEEVGNIIDKTLSGASMGASVGGGYGALIGGAVGLVTSLVMNKQKKMAERRAEYLKTEQQIINQHKEYNHLLTKEMFLMNDYKSIFGTKELSIAIGYMDIYLTQMEKFYRVTKKNYQAQRFIGTFRSYDSGVPSESNRRGDPNRYGKVEDTRTSLEKIEIKTLAKGGYQSITEYYPDLIKKNGELNESLADSILKTREFKEGHKEALEQIVNYYKEAKEAKKQFDEYLKNTFGELGTSIVDSVVKSLQTGEDAFESFAKSVGNVIGKLGKQLVYEIFVAEKFKTFQKEIEKVYKKGANKELTKEEVARKSAELVAQFGNSMKGNLDNMKALYKSMNDLAKSYDPNFDFLNEQRKAVEKGLARMSQDSADELNGQFRLQTQLSAEIKNAALQTANFIREMHQSMQSNAAQQLIHLAGIEANTYKLNKMETDLAGVKNVLSDIQTKGIKIRS